MKVLIPVWGFGKAGGNRVLSKLADELIDQKIQVDFICPENSGPPYFPTKAGVIWVNTKGEIVGHPSEKKGSFISYLFSLTRGLKKIKSISSYDVIFTNLNLTVYPALLAGLKSKVVYYIQSYESGVYMASGKSLKNFVLSLLARGTYHFGLFCIVNAEIFRSYKDIHCNRVLYPGIDFNNFFPPAQSKTGFSKIILGTIGRNIPSKGTRYIVSAFKELFQEYPNLELHIAFSSPEEFGVHPGIKYILPANDEELGDFYRSLDYYLCAVYIEPGAFHYPVAEAMSCKIPVITTKYYPANSNNAFMVDTQNSKGFVDQFKYAIEHPQIRETRVEKAFKDIRHLTWENSGRKLLRYLYEKTSSETKE